LRSVRLRANSPGLSNWYVRTGPRNGELAWMPLTHWRVLRTLHYPGDAGVVNLWSAPRAHRGPTARRPSRALPREAWIALFPAARPRRAPRCCKAWRSAGGAGGGWPSAHTRDGTKVPDHHDQTSSGWLDSPAGRLAGAARSGRGAGSARRSARPL